MTLKANALVSLASMKAFLKIPSSVSTEDALVEDFINEASQLIETYCNRKFMQRSYSELYNGARTHEILLNQWPVTAIINLWVDPKRNFSSDSLLDASEYVIREDEKQEGIIVERLESIFPQGRAVVKIEYAAGYPDLASLPSDLQLACKRTAAYYWKMQQNEDFSETNKSKGDENVTLIDGIPQAATQILEFYKRLEMLAPPDPVRNL